MRIGLIGIGKMGRMVKAFIHERGHDLAWEQGPGAWTSGPKEADVAIDFSVPDGAYDRIVACFEAGVPVVSGTTGWLDRLPEAEAACRAKESGFLHATNFSLGVHLFFALNERLAELMVGRPEYRADIEEVHHIHKRDAPSGTALTLAQSLIDGLPRLDTWQGLEGPLPSGHGTPVAQEGVLPIHSIRQGEVPGTHRVRFDGPVDTLSLEHRAKGREGFALGAVVAAEWLAGKTGVFAMKDVLKA